jgi:hypothetical protein
MAKTSKQNSTCTLQICRGKHKPTRDEFNIAIVETVDESLSSFCNLNKEAVYLRLENTFNIKKQEIPSRLGEFADAIEQIFGVGAKLIEIRIIGALHKKLPGFVFFPAKGDIDFKEYVAGLRAFLLQTL